MPVLGRGYLPDYIDEQSLAEVTCMVYDGVGRVCCPLPLVPAPEGCIRAGIPAYRSWPPKPSEFGPEPGIWEPHAPEHGRPRHRFVEMQQVTDRPHPHLFHGVDTSADEKAHEARRGALVGGVFGAVVGAVLGYQLEVLASAKPQTALLGAGLIGIAGAAMGMAFDIQEAEASA